MSGVAIYMEGGGQGKGGRSALREGMDGFLRRLRPRRGRRRGGGSWSAAVRAAAATPHDSVRGRRGTLPDEAAGRGRLREQEKALPGAVRKDR